MQRIIIQPDWDQFFKNVEQKSETVWIQYKSSKSSSVNGKILIKHTELPQLTSFEEKQIYINPDFSIENISKENKSIQVSYRNQDGTITTFIAPDEAYAFHFNKKMTDKRESVYSIDVTDGGLGVSCSTDGSLLVWTTNEGLIRRQLEGHINDVNVCKFFPSGIVVLSGGSDLRAKVWSAETGKSPVQLGHTGGVTDICIVDKGRNIVTVCRDGKCRLWDVGQSNCIATFENFECIINGCDIISLNKENMSLLPIAKEPQTDREVGTEDKLVCFACENGFLRVHGLRSRTQIFEYKCESAVNCCSFVNECEVICGTQDGHIYLFDLKNKNMLESWKEFRSSILSIKKFEPTKGLIITTADGSCFIRDLNNASQIIELTGPDCDHVYKATYNNTHIFTCCRDGYVRKYDLKHILNSQ